MKYADVLKQAEEYNTVGHHMKLDPVKMKPHRKKALVKALRSGEYRQGNGLLCQGDKWRHEGDKFCCLGVLTDQYIRAAKGLTKGWEEDERQPVVGGGKSWVAEEIPVYSLDGNAHMPPDTVYLWSGLDEHTGGLLAHLNDHGASFKQIARYIEENL